jgi:uncharacterized protein involved in exopolysaccharide biosynthesis
MQPAGGGGGFLAAAQQGMFAIDTVSADQMMMSIQQMRTTLKARLARIHLLQEKAKLGDLHEAKAIAGSNARVAGLGEDQQSLKFVLERFDERLEDAHQALQIGMRNYAELERQAERDFKRIGHK